MPPIYGSCTRMHLPTVSSFDAAQVVASDAILNSLRTMSDAELQKAIPAWATPEVTVAVNAERKRRAAKRIYAARYTSHDPSLIFVKDCSAGGMSEAHMEYPHDSEASLRHAVTEVVGVAVEQIGTLSGWNLYRVAEG